MKITIEQVEKLQERANVTYEEAKEALENCDGDILEALIKLEKEGKTAKPNGGSYSTGKNARENSNQNTNENAGNANNNQNGQNQYSNNQYQNGNSEFGEQVNTFWNSLRKLFHKGNVNHFYMTKDGRVIIKMPINLLLLLLLIFNMALVIVIIVFLFLGYRYSFRGPNIKKGTVNDAMDSMSNAAENIKNTVMDETNRPNNGDNSSGNNQ